MVNNNNECASSPWNMANLCAADVYWTNKKWCQQSCFEAGNGYPGDNCCTSGDKPIYNPSSDKCCLETCTPSFTGESCGSCVGDITGPGVIDLGGVTYASAIDGVVNVEDMLSVLSDYGAIGACDMPTDVSGPDGVPDCYVNVHDLLTVFGNFRCKIA